MSSRHRGGTWILVWVLAFVAGLVSAQVPTAGARIGAVNPSPRPEDIAAAILPIEVVSHRATPVQPTSAHSSPLGAERYLASYDFEVDVDPEGGSAAVVERLAITNRGETAIREINLFVLAHLDASGFRELSLASIAVEGAPVEPKWTENGANMVVSLPRNLEPGSSTAIVIRFTLRPGSRADSVMASALSRVDGEMQFLLWYPMLSDGHGARLNGDGASALPASAITYRIRATEPVSIAVPGTVLERTEREVRGRIDAARDFAFAVSRHFHVWTRRTGGDVTVHVYTGEGKAGRVTRDLATAALDRYAALLATPYPASDLVIIAGTMDMESSGLVFLRQEDLENPYAVDHEVAHQWFYWLVGNDQLREPWLDEALATYLAGGLKPRHEDGYCSSHPVNSPVQAFPSADPGSSWQACDGYVQTVYYKGSWLLETVRVAMGDGPFIAALREYLTRFRFRIATTADLLAVLRAHSPAVTDALLAPWLASGGALSQPAPADDPY